jgi:hypothetical protein
MILSSKKKVVKRVNKRDQAIMDHLRLFGCMSRNQIIGMHFNDLKNPVNSCNSVLKRLSRDGHIKCSTLYSPYVYFPSTSKIKENSQKIPHFLELVNTIIEMRSFKDPKHVIIEPKYSINNKVKGNIEPDIFAMWFGNPTFIEVQRNTYTQAVMQKKVDLYEAYFHSDEWKSEPYQTFGKERFPSILIITNTRYSIKSEFVKIHQAPSISDFVERLKGAPQQTKIRANGVKLKVN